VIKNELQADTGSTHREAANGSTITREPDAASA